MVLFSAGAQDRDGSKPVLLDTYLRTTARFVFADGRTLTSATTLG